MQISVITPTNSLAWLKNAYRSLERQTLKDWEWVVVMNGALLTELDSDEGREFVHNKDPRVRLVTHVEEGNVGALKARGCCAAEAPYMLEFDHDDELDSTCLEKVVNAFKETDAVFVYSNAARVNKDGTPNLFDPAYGWEYSSEPFDGGMPEMLITAKHPLPLPQNIAKILHAPDHVRAWSRSAYFAAGGHDPKLKVCDDIDLICKLYKLGKFHHINETLYKYRVHGENTWLKNVELIDKLMWEIYDKNIESMAQLYWTDKKRCVDLGGGINSPAGWESVDVHNASIVADLNERWPFADDSVGVFRAYDVIEHLKSPIHVMNEAYRTLVHGGLFMIEVPSTDGRGAFQDPSHISFFNSNSFWYYTKKQQNRYIQHLGVNCRFQTVRVLNYYPSEWHKLHQIVYTKIHLAAIKDGPRLHGLYEI